MTALNFPSSPTDGQIFTSGATSWQYTLATNSWGVIAGTPIGFTGSKGDTGYTGSKGDTGFVGSKGDIGFTGSQGDIGFVGSQGTTGFTGSKGDTGFTGSIGFTGSQGNIGFTGSQGTTGFTGSQGATGFTGSKGDIGYTGSGPNYLTRIDDRIIEPTALTSGRMNFGFTSWNNNNGSPYADYLHLRSYTDATGGADNLVMFRKDAIGMRIWQQSFDSASAYSTYRDAVLADSSGNVVVTGNLGVGNTAGYKFDVQSSLNTYGRFYSTTAGSGGGIYLQSGSADLSEITQYGTELYIYNNDSSTGKITFTMGSTEAMRITATGQLLFGTTSGSSTSGVGIKLISSATDPWSAQVCTSSTSSYTTYHLYSTNAGAYRFYVNGAGTILATSTTISAISDIRYKENIRDLEDGLDILMRLKPRRFDWKPGKGKDIKNDRGWIAQEFEQVFPEMIGEWKDPAPEGEEPYKSVQADLIPILVKAIQEQQQMINELKNEINILKGNSNG
jgi:hypothetical protein